ncbi:MAG: hypothetical protein ABDH32_04295 [Candidatus Caldarchaeales archaeon]
MQKDGENSIDIFKISMIICGCSACDKHSWKELYRLGRVSDACLNHVIDKLCLEYYIEEISLPEIRKVGYDFSENTV